MLAFPQPTLRSICKHSCLVRAPTRPCGWLRERRRASISSAAPPAEAVRMVRDEANRARALLRTPIRQDLALAGLLRDWRIAIAA